jgi:hypothetical protein
MKAMRKLIYGYYVFRASNSERHKRFKEALRWLEKASSMSDFPHFDFAYRVRLTMLTGDYERSAVLLKENACAATLNPTNADENYSMMYAKYIEHVLAEEDAMLNKDISDLGNVKGVSKFTSTHLPVTPFGPRLTSH